MVDSILPFILAHFILAYGLGYTSASSSIRPLLLVLIVVCCLVSVRSSTVRSVPGLVGCDYVIGFIFHASHFLCLAKLSPPSGLTISGRNRWTLNQLFDARWGVKYIPPFNTKDKTYIPSRWRLFLHRLWDAAWTVCIIYILQTHKLNTVPEDFYGVPNGFLKRLSDVSSREWIIRIYITIIGNVIPYCGLRAAHSIATCFALACGDTPERWPPLFGSIGDAYTIRRFWSHFWHHLMRKAFTSHAVFFVQNVLRLPRRGQVARYATVAVTFMISALLHILNNPEYELCSARIQIPFFVRIIGAVCLEDAVIWAYRSNVRSLAAIQEIGSPKRKPVSFKEKSAKVVDTPHHATALIWKLLGYSWVVAFEIWGTSKMMYGLWTC